MCFTCYEKAGEPKELPPEVDRFIALADELYDEHPTGGPLHAVLDDWNIDGEIKPYDSIEVGGRTRELCDEIAALMNGWTVDQRYAAMAKWNGVIAGAPAG